MSKSERRHPLVVTWENRQEAMEKTARAKKTDLNTVYEFGYMVDFLKSFLEQEVDKREFKTRELEVNGQNFSFELIASQIMYAYCYGEIKCDWIPGFESDDGRDYKIINQDEEIRVKCASFIRMEFVNGLARELCGQILRIK